MFWDEAMDVIDQLIAEWASEKPELATEAMQVVGRLIRLGQRLKEEANTLLQPMGLSYSDFDLLATLRRKGNPYTLSPTALQQSVVLTSGAMTACLRRLERKGLISRGEDASDGRKRSATLTPKGVELVERIAVERFALAEREVAMLEPAKRKRLADMLRELG